MTSLTKDTLIAAVTKHHRGSRYALTDGRTMIACTISDAHAALRDDGWRNVSHLDGYDFRQMGLHTARGRYASGARMGRECEVIVIRPIN